ncbi:MAG: hypothetical protein KDJ15_00835 [Alphaproteobacteria bacterium]|nr:hypothetical protein [Alphaproteobacteria bacterium]
MKLVESIADIPNGDLQDLYRRWTALPRGTGGSVPAKKAADAAFLGVLAPYCKFSSLHPPFRIRYDVVGPALQKLYDEPMAGQYLDVLFDPWIRKVVQETYKTAHDEALPVYERKGFSTAWKKIGYEYLILPFTDEADGAITAFVTCLFPLNKETVWFDDWKNAVDATPWLNG